MQKKNNSRLKNSLYIVTVMLLLINILYNGQ